MKYIIDGGVYLIIDTYDYFTIPTRKWTNFISLLLNTPIYRKKIT